MFYFYLNKSEEYLVFFLNGVLFFFGFLLESYRVIFLIGKKENNYFVNVIIVIRDVYGEYVDKKFWI